MLVFMPFAHYRAALDRSAFQTRYQHQIDEKLACQMRLRREAGHAAHSRSTRRNSPLLALEHAVAELTNLLINALEKPIIHLRDRRVS
jgi:hypothetical protein